MAGSIGERVFGSKVAFRAFGADDTVIDPGVVPNSEIPNATTVAYRQLWSAPPHDEATENAAVYCRIDHRPGETDFRYGIYAEITQQSLVGGSFIKVVHRGAGDAQYIALIGDGPSGYGQETAMFGGWQDPGVNTIPKQENGFLASFQGAGGFQESVKNQSNSCGFVALVHDDGVDPTDPDPWATNYGLFYAINSLSNAFVVRVSEFAENFAQFKVIDHTPNQRPRWAVFSDGQMHTYGDEATAGTPDQPSKPVVLRGYYWDGASEEDRQVRLVAAVAGAPTALANLNIYAGPSSGETLIAYIGEDAGAGTPGLNLQGHVVTAVGSLTLETGAGLGLDLQGKDVVNVETLTFTTNGTTGLDLQGQTAINAGSVTLLTGTGVGFDAQGKNVINVGSLTLGGGAATANASLDMQGTDGALMPPRLTTSQRDALTPSAGMVVYNTTLGTLQCYVSAAWVSVSGPATVPTNTPTGTTQEIDWATGPTQILDLGSASGDLTLTFANPTVGESYALIVVQGATARTIEWPAATLWPEGTPPEISTGEDGEDVLGFLFAQSNYYGSYISAGYA